MGEVTGSVESLSLRAASRPVVSAFRRAWLGDDAFTPIFAYRFALPLSVLARCHAFLTVLYQLHTFISSGDALGWCITRRLLSDLFRMRLVDGLRLPLFFLFLAVLAITTGCRNSSDRSSSEPPTHPALISIDGAFDDWSSVDLLHDDPDGDGGRVDLQDLSVAHDDSFLFVRFRIGSRISLQERNDIELRIDTDADATTGDADGADVSWTFGDRSGAVYAETSRNITHADIGLASLPTVASETYEIALARSSTPGGQDWLKDGDTLCLSLQSGSDRMPDESRACYTITGRPERTDSPMTEIPASNGGIRLMSYNVERDALFTSGPAASYQRIFDAVAPDVFALQEVYENDAETTRRRIAELTNTSPGAWYTAKAGLDLVLVSRFEVLDTHTIPGFEDYESAAHLLDTNAALGRPLLLINMHPPCCSGGDPSSDVKRQRVVDAVAAFLRSTRRGTGPMDVPEQTPVAVVGDMNFVGDPQQPATLAEGTIINRSLFGESSSPDWDNTSFADVNPPQTGAPLHVTWVDPESRFPPGRLDFAFISDSVLRAENAFVLETAYLPASTGLSPDDTRTASDHLPIVLDLALN